MARGAAGGSSRSDDGGSLELWAVLRRAADALQRLEAAGLARTRARLRPAHVSVLGALLDASPLTPGQLCARCETEPSTLTGLLRSLEEQGLVQRERVIADERTFALHLTPRGRAAARVALRNRARAWQAALRALPREGESQLAQLLGQLAAGAQDALENPGMRRR